MMYMYKIMKTISSPPSKHLLLSKTSSRHLEDVFSVTILCLPRRLEGVITVGLPKTSSKRL